MPEGAGGIRVLARALRILEALGAGHGESLAELARATGLPRSTVHRILAALEGEGYLEQDGAGRYRASLRLVLLGQRVLGQNALLAAVRPAMRRLLAATGETVFCGTLDEEGVLVLDVLPSSRPISPLPRPGSRAPAHASSMGKVLLAHLPAAAQGRFLARPLPRFTPHTITEPPRLADALQQARQTGYAVNAEEEDLGVACVAAPVRDASGQVVAALSVAAPAPRMWEAGLPRFVGLVSDAAERASRSLGWTGPRQEAWRRPG
jgi:DNA-binding IclR family transcriptional regulator